MAYPTQGMLEVCALAVITGYASYACSPGQRTGEKRGIFPQSTNRFAVIAGGAAFTLLVFAWVRWTFAGMPSAGLDGLGTLTNCIAAAVAAFSLARLFEVGSASAAKTFAMALLLIAISGAIYGLAQYFWIYDRLHAQMLADIGTRRPTPMETSLLYHFELKRVASFWGDPNAFGGFEAMSLGVAFAFTGMVMGRKKGEDVYGKTRTGTETERRQTPNINTHQRGPKSQALELADELLGWAAVVAVPFVLLAIYFSGSRGAILDAVIVGIIWVIAPRIRMGSTNHVASGVATVFCALALFSAFANIGFSQDTTSPNSDNGPALAGSASSIPSTKSISSASQHPPSPTMLSRTSTLTERLFYLKTGWSIFLRNPILGSGAGAVDLYYGHYKPAEARETKYLHNWIAQLAVENGFVGLVCGIVCTVAILFASFQTIRNRSPIWKALACFCIVFLFDGLIELSFNNRELMNAFGMCAGIVLATDNPKSRAPSPGSAFQPGFFKKHAFKGLSWTCAMLLVIGVLPPLRSLQQRQLGETELEEGNLNSARSHFRSAASWSPRDPLPLLALARIEEQSGNPEDAMQFLQQAIRRQPLSASLHSEAGQLDLRQGRAADAERQFVAATQFYPTNADHQYQLARALAAQGKHTEAIEHARLAVEYGFLYADVYRDYLAQLEGAAPRK